MDPKKGGVGKTTTTLNLAYYLAKMGKKVLAVNFDSQANLITCFGVENLSEIEVTIGHLIMAMIENETIPDPEEYICTSDGIVYIPSSIFLSVVDAKLRLELGAEKMLSRILEPLRDRYEVILIDTCLHLEVLQLMHWLRPMK